MRKLKDNIFTNLHRQAILAAMVTETTSIAGRLPGRIFFPGRSASLSSQIVTDVRDALFGKKLKPGDVLGTENEIAARYTELSRDFHLAVAEASHNRVLVVQLISLQHVSWPARNPTLTPKVAQRILDVHKELLALIEIRDGPGARLLMDDHVKMIRTRRVTEHASRSLRGAPKARARDPGTSSEPGFRVRRFAPSRNDRDIDCC